MAGTFSSPCSLSAITDMAAIRLLDTPERIEQYFAVIS
jgi:hypothetical protein